ncbi:MAG TPA: class I SAM-dependent methyltransferase [Thermoanaerobaculia bacterium]|nr:class I SAM-dependent methyltransferase [Thermoanaerobaculia bacterium]
MSWFDQLAVRGSDGPFDNLPPAGRLLREPCYIDCAALPLRGPIDDYLARDTFPIPSTADREGYHDDRHFEYWLSGLRDFVLVEERLRSLGAELRAGERVVELGCATGRVLRHFLSQGPAVDLWGLDLNRRHIEWIRRFLGPRPRVAQTTVLPHLPIESDSCALVLAFSVFTHIDELDLAWIAELRRILRPGGFAYLTLHTEHTWSGLQPGSPLLTALQTMHSDTEGIEAPAGPGGVLPGERLVFRPSAGGPYVSNVFHSTAYIRDAWGRLLSLRSEHREGSDYQDVFILQKS